MLQSSEAANCSRRELRAKAARTAAGDHSSGSEDEGDARSEASIDSQCASIRVATVYAVAEGDDFYARAGSCEYTRGQFMSDAKAEKAAKTSLITGLTLGELKDKVVEQAEEIAMWKRTSEWVWDKLRSAEASCTCKRPKPKPVESEDEEKYDNIFGVLPLSAHVCDMCIQRVQTSSLAENICTRNAPMSRPRTCVCITHRCYHAHCRIFSSATPNPNHQAASQAQLLLQYCSMAAATHRPSFTATMLGICSSVCTYVCHMCRMRSATLKSYPALGDPDADVDSSVHVQPE
jgi:hypothetical protein